MTEYILSIDPVRFILLTTVAVACQFIFLKKTLFSLFDPLCIYLFTNSFSIAFVIYLFIDGEITDGSYFISFFACNIAFALGLNIATKRFKKLDINQITLNKKQVNESIKIDKLLYTLLYIIFIITILANIFLILQTGELPLLSNNADSAKVTSRQDGLGIVFRVNDVLLPLGISIVLFKIFPPLSKINSASANQFNLIFILVILILIFVSGGAKGSALALIAIFIPCQLLNTYFSSHYKLVIDRLVSSILPVGCLLAFYILLKNFNDVKYLDPFEGLMVRIVAYGDAFYYFYKYDLMKKFDLNFFNYIIDTLNPLLSLLKITSYDTAIGEKLLIESINLTTGGFGPNAPYPVYGLMYFGFLGSCIFSFIIGCITSLVRTKLLFWTLNNPSELNMVIYTICFYHILKLPSDYTSFLSALYASLIFVTPVFILSKLFTINHPFFFGSNKEE